MVTLFDEYDLISFGEYMISEERKNLIEKHKDIKNKEETLKEVTPLDFNTWVQKRHEELKEYHKKSTSNSEGGDK